MIDVLDVDGVPMLFAKQSGPMRAGLTFRVGRADETLARAGITHLTEHLALHRHDLTDYHINGSTGPVVTDFHMQGKAKEVVAFLAQTCRALHNIPADRMQTEKAILRTEWSSRTRSAVADMPMWRYGARDYGLSSFPEWGLPMLTLGDLRQWAARYFTQGNAVLWLAGESVPAGLSLPLPAGERWPAPAPSSALPTTPAYFPGPEAAVGVSGVVRCSPAAIAFTGLLKRELFRALRQESGLSYSASAAYEPRGDGFATIAALADALPEKQGAVLGGFVDVLAGLRVGRIDEADLAVVVGQAEEELSQPEAAAGMLSSQAFDLLVGETPQSLDELRTGLCAVEIADVHGVAQEIIASALLMVPGGEGADWAGYAQAPTMSAEAVTGARHEARAGNGRALLIGPEGVSLTDPTATATVRFAECATLMRWPDGARQLIGYDGIAVRVEPTLYAVSPANLAAIDATVPPERHVLMPPRAPGEIPDPLRPQKAAKAESKPGIAETLVTIVASTVAVLLVCLGGLATVAIGTDKETSSDGWTWAVIAMIWVIAAAVGAPAVMLIRRRRARDGKR